MHGDKQQAAGPAGIRSDAADLEHISIDEVLAQFAVQPDRGLSSTEAGQRLEKYGPNALIEKETSFLTRLLGHFMGPVFNRSLLEHRP